MRTEVIYVRDYFKMMSSFQDFVWILSSSRDSQPVLHPRII